MGLKQCHGLPPQGSTQGAWMLAWPWCVLSPRESVVVSRRKVLQERLFFLYGTITTFSQVQALMAVSRALAVATVCLFPPHEDGGQK